MTFCAAMKVDQGLVGLADTRITSGAERITARKVTVHEHGRHSIFLMTSGLRAARDKALTYFDEILTESGNEFDKLYKAVNALGEQVRRVIREDKKALVDSGFEFNLHSLVGGQLENDDEHRLFLLYPQGNWVEVSRGTPYYIIGESAYGKPLLDRALRYESSLEEALKLGYLAFDATRTSSTDVDFPLDMVLYRRDTYAVIEHRFQREDLIVTSEWWQDRINESLGLAPAPWLKELIEKVSRAGPPGVGEQ